MPSSRPTAVISIFAAAERLIAVGAETGLDERRPTMNYNQSVDYIFSFSSLNAKPSLERIDTLLSSLNEPQNSFKSVHIAGTNGKGSVSTYIASVLTESGYKTGLFTSPHIRSFCERIRLDGKPIAESEVAEITSSLVPTVDGMSEKPTAFDLITAVAFEYFRRNNCDFAVLECGLGGRFDSTNIVTPEISVLCSISMDHVGLLGDTVADITREKCGIIKCGTPVVSYPFKKTKDVFNPQPAESAKIIREAAMEKQSELIISDPDEITSSSCSLGDTTLEIDGLTLTSRLCGIHQKANILTAYSALRELSKSYRIPNGSIVSGFYKASIDARLEKVSENPNVIIDGGHNADCARALRMFIESELKDEKLTAVIAMMRDKQCDEVLAELAGMFDKIIVTQVDSNRACEAHELARKAESYNKNVTVETKVHTAIKRAVEIGNTVIIFGSFYLAGEAKEYFSS